MFRVGEAHDPPSRTVVVLDAELLRWRSLFSNNVMDHFFLDTQSQNLLEPGEAGFYVSSSQRPQPLRLSDSASTLQLIPATLESG